MPNPPINSVGLIAKPRSRVAAKLLPELLEWLAGHNVRVALDEEAASYAGRKDGSGRAGVAAASQLLVVLGGDGTLLAAARAAVGLDIPIIGVNLGSLGFLTAIRVDQMYQQLERALHGDYQVIKRRMLHAELWRDGSMAISHEALNDVVLTKSEIARMIDLEAYVDGNFVCVYKADGLILSTPTGSTAYSLSAGGPILLPGVAALLMTPICPHTLTNRPVVVPDGTEIEIVVRGPAPTYLTLDGQLGEALEPGDRVRCRRSEHFIHLVRPPEKLFFDVLREKLKWGGR